MPDQLDCLFCKIVAGDIPADKVAETGDYLGFRDIDPKAPTHILVIPKKHVRSMNDVDDSGLIGGLMVFARKLAESEGVTKNGYRLVANTNADGGQTVFHLHVHLLGGRPLDWPPG